jgi:hypothetical protein
MTKWGMPQVMSKADGFNRILICTQRSCNGSTHLGDFQSISQTSAEIIAFKIYKNLVFVFQAPEGRYVQNAIPVTLKSSKVI